MKQLHLRRWFWLHQWSSLICTVFLFLLCLTGLPLIFAEEINRALTDDPVPATATVTTGLASVQAMVDESRRRHPADIVASLFMDDEAPRVIVVMAPSWQQWKAAPASRVFLAFDLHSGAFLKESGAVQ